MDGAGGEFGEGIKDAGVGARIFRDAVFEDSGIEVEQKAVHAEDGDTDAGFLDGLVVLLVKNPGGEVEARVLVVEKVLFPEPGLVAAGMPAGDAVEGEGIAVFGDLPSDIGVGEPVAEHEVEEFANAMGQARDFATATAGGRKGGLLDWWINGLLGGGSAGMRTRGRGGFGAER